MLTLLKCEDSKTSLASFGYHLIVLHNRFFKTPYNTACILKNAVVLHRNY